MGNSTRTVLDVFFACDFNEQSLLCELFLHNMICEHASMHMVAHILSYMGDLQLRAFIYLMTNQIEWHLIATSANTNEEKETLWIRVELGMATK